MPFLDSLTYVDLVGYVGGMGGAFRHRESHLKNFCSKLLECCNAMLAVDWG